MAKTGNSSSRTFLSYQSELSRIWYFSFALLPLLSAFSLLSGYYFVSRFLIAPALPMIPAWAVILLSCLIVGLIEIIKYFLSPLFAKSLHFRTYIISFPIALAIFFFAGLSIYFSVQGLQAFFSDSDNKLEILSSSFKTELSVLAFEKDSLLQIKKQKLSSLRASFSKNPELLIRQEKYLSRISYLQSQKNKALDSGFKPDSVLSLYSSLIKREQQSLDLLRLSAASSILDLKSAERLENEMNALEKKYEERSIELEHEFEKEKAVLLLENSSISRYLYIFSFSIELLLILALGYIQLYQLRFQKKTTAPEKEKFSPKARLRKKPQTQTKSAQSTPTVRPLKRLSQKQREEVKKRLLQGEKPEALALEFQISMRTIYRIKNQTA